MLAWQGCCYGRDAGMAGTLSCLQIRRRCRTVPACGSGSCSQMRDLKMTLLHCSLPRPWDTVAGGAPTGPWADRQGAEQTRMIQAELTVLCLSSYAGVRTELQTLRGPGIFPRRRSRWRSWWHSLKYSPCLREARAERRDLAP